MISNNTITILSSQKVRIPGNNVHCLRVSELKIRLQNGLNIAAKSWVV